MTGIYSLVAELRSNNETERIYTQPPLSFGHLPLSGEESYRASDNLSSRVSETNVAIQIEVKKGIHIVLDCEATALRTLLHYRSQWQVKY